MAKQQVLTEEERRKLAGGKSVLPDDSSPKSDAERSIVQEEAAAGVIGARDANRMDRSKQLITGSVKRKFSYDPYNAVAKSRVQLALLELIGTFCCGGGQTPTRNGGLTGPGPGGGACGHERHRRGQVAFRPFAGLVLPLTRDTV